MTDANGNLWLGGSGSVVAPAAASTTAFVLYGATVAAPSPPPYPATLQYWGSAYPASATTLMTSGQTVTTGNAVGTCGAYALEFGKTGDLLWFIADYK